MSIRCSFTTGGRPYLFQLHRADVAAADLRFSLRGDGTLIHPDGSEHPVRIQQGSVCFEAPQQFQEDEQLVTAVEFSGDCVLSADPDLQALQPGAELDYELELHLADGRRLAEGNDWEFLERDSLLLS